MEAMVRQLGSGRGPARGAPAAGSQKIKGEGFGVCVKQARICKNNPSPMSPEVIMP